MTAVPRRAAPAGRCVHGLSENIGEVRSEVKKRFLGCDAKLACVI